MSTLANVLSQVKATISMMPAAEAMPLIAQQSALLIDVREPQEFQQDAIAGAVNIPRGLLEFQIEKVCTDLNQPIFVHCAAGGRACFAAEQLQRLGYKQVTAITCKFTDIKACQC